MKFWRAASVFLGSLLALGCGASPHRNEVPQPEEIQHALDATVVLLYEGWTVGNVSLVCGGEYITPNVIVTAYHCIDSATGCDQDDVDCYRRRPVAFKQDWAGSVVAQGTILALDKSVDLALILTSDAGPPVQVQPVLPVIGERVFSIGHPKGAVNTIAEGHVLLPLTLTPEPSIAVNIAIGPGSSGGGLYNSDGQLIGICSAMTLDGKVGYFIPASQAWRMLVAEGLS